MVLGLTFHEPPRTWRWRHHSSPGRERSWKGSLAALACEDHVVEGRNVNSSELLILSSLFVLLWVQLKFLFVLERWWSVLEEIQRLQLPIHISYQLKLYFEMWNLKDFLLQLEFFVLVQLLCLVQVLQGQLVRLLRLKGGTDEHSPHILRARI